MCWLNDLPGRDIASLLHEGAQSEPETVLDGEVIGEHVFGRVDASRHGRRVHLFERPLGGTETTDDEEDDAHPQISEGHAHPNLFGQWVHETEHTRQFLDRFFDHDADTQVHERFGEVDDAFAGRDNRQGSDGYIRFLIQHNPHESFPPPHFCLLLYGISWREWNQPPCLLFIDSFSTGWLDSVRKCVWSPEDEIGRRSCARLRYLSLSDGN